MFDYTDVKYSTALANIVYNVLSIQNQKMCGPISKSDELRHKKHPSFFHLQKST